MSDPALDVVRQEATCFETVPEGLDAVLDRIGDARLVLIGEATHGTHEFYAIRAALTRALIVRKGFNVVAAEADWPHADRANRWVRHLTAEPDAVAALGDFTCFPRWMWRNRDVAEFLAWLRGHNAWRPAGRPIGFYGLDLYSLHASIDAVLRYLRRVDPQAAERARSRYNCFDDFGEEVQTYGFAASLGLTRSCEDEVVAELTDLRRRTAESASQNGRIAPDDQFVAEQDARLVRNAESYYRAMFGGRVESWNLRETHMMETLEALLAHVTDVSGSARAVVWGHNSHLGDARATEMGQSGEVSLGQLARERYGEAARLIGFTTQTGTVTAASNWDEPTLRFPVPPALPASYEALFHAVGLERFVIAFDDDAVCEALTPTRLERAIGVIYRSKTERVSHYFRAQLAQQFDLVVHVDQTHAVSPLETGARIETESVADLAETSPAGR